MKQVFKTRNQYKNGQQAGVTLLLAILVLSSILAISFSLATILFIEVRTSSDLPRTEASIYGAQALSEEAMFGIQQRVPQGSFSYISQINDNKVTLTSTSSSLTDTVVQDVVKTNANTFSNTPNIYFFYDANAANPATAGSGYGRIQVTYLDTGNNDPLKVYLCQFNPNGPLAPGDTSPACSDPASSYWVYTDTLTKGTVGNYSAFIDPTKQQELILYNGNGASASANIYVQIEAFGADKVTPKGIPNYNETTIDITANNGGVIRKIRTTVPNQTSAVGGHGNSASVDLTSSGGYVSIPDAPKLRLSTFTVEAWVFPRSIKAGWQPLVTKQLGGGSRNYGLFIVPNSMQVHYSFQAADCATWRSYSSTNSMVQNQWNHVAMTYDGALFTLYINGVQDGPSQNIVSTPCQSSSSLLLGNTVAAYSDTDAILDDVRIWNIARSAAQITSAMSTELTGAEAGLVGYWKFNEGTGSTSVDNTASPDTATLSGNATWSSSVPFP